MSRGCGVRPASPPCAAGRESRRTCTPERGVLSGVPVAHGYQGDRRCFWEAGEKGPDGAGLVVDPGPRDGPAAVIANGEERIVLAQP